MERWGEGGVVTMAMCTPGGLLFLHAASLPDRRLSPVPAQLFLLLHFTSNDSPARSSSSLFSNLAAGFG